MEMGSQSHLAPVEEEFINMEITTPYYSNSSPQIQSKDFEFQHLSSASSSASDLFYRGKLLRPPPPFLSGPCTTSNTPSDSCNISPSQSCRPSCDLIMTPTHFTHLSITTFFNNNNNNNQHPPRNINNNNNNQHPPRNINNNNNNNNNSWSKMKKLNKRSYLAHKLKSSRAFLKSLFFTKQSPNTDDPTSYSRFGKKLATLINKNGIIDDDHRRSFSGAIASDSSSSSTSTSTSTSSSFNQVQFLRRSSSAAEIEVSIDAAIAHCKKSYATN